MVPAILANLPTPGYRLDPENLADLADRDFLQTLVALHRQLYQWHLVNQAVQLARMGLLALVVQIVLLLQHLPMVQYLQIDLDCLPFLCHLCFLAIQQFLRVLADLMDQYLLLLH